MQQSMRESSWQSSELAERRTGAEDSDAVANAGPYVALQVHLDAVRRPHIRYRKQALVGQQARPIPDDHGKHRSSGAVSMSQKAQAHPAKASPVKKLSHHHHTACRVSASNLREETSSHCHTHHHARNGMHWY